jgi:hypothetical protein
MRERRTICTNKRAWDIDSSTVSLGSFCREINEKNEGSSMMASFISPPGQHTLNKFLEHYMSANDC